MSKSLTYLLIISLSVFFHQSFIISQNYPCIINYFGTIELTPDISLEGTGLNIDTIEFWKAPDINESLMFVTAKNNALVEVWKYPFDENSELTSLTHSSFGDVAFVNGLQVDQEANLLFVAIGSPESCVSVFTLPNLQFVTEFNSNGAAYHSEPNLTLLKMTNDEKRLYVSANTIVYYHNVTDTSSSSFGEYIGSFSLPMEIETLQADNYYQNLIIPDENNKTGIYAYFPDGSPYPEFGANNFGSGVFQADAEGIWLNTCFSVQDGFFVVSDQINSLSEFEFFDRQFWHHLGTMKIAGVNKTDGIATFPYSSADYPMGLFAAIDSDNRTVLVNWDKIFSEIESNGGLPVELSFFIAEIINGNEIHLNWQTETEVDNYGFEIERASSLTTPRQDAWEMIGFVEGHGNSNSPKEYSFVDKNINSEKYSYRLKQLDTDGSFTYSDVVEIDLKLPDRFKLSQNYPNPFNPTTVINYQLPEAGKVTLSIYDILGNEVRILVNEERSAGNYEIEFNATGLPSGVYFYILRAGSFVESKKMLLLK